jgi:hypothetical protein
VKSTASATPTVTAAASAKNVIRSVISSDPESVDQSATRVCAMSTGPGRM